MPPIDITLEYIVIKKGRSGLVTDKYIKFYPVILYVDCVIESGMGFVIGRESSNSSLVCDIHFCTDAHEKG